MQVTVWKQSALGTSLVLIYDDRVIHAVDARTLAQMKLKRGWTRDRTGDTRIFSPLLYLLSYPALSRREIKLQIGRFVKRSERKF